VFASHNLIDLSPEAETTNVSKMATELTAEL